MKRHRRRLPHRSQNPRRRRSLRPLGALGLVVCQPKIALVESGRGAEERFVQVLSPLPLRTSAQELATTQSLFACVQSTSWCDVVKHEFVNVARKLTL